MQLSPHSLCLSLCIMLTVLWDCTRKSSYFKPYGQLTCTVFEFLETYILFSFFYSFSLYSPLSVFILSVKMPLFKKKNLSFPISTSIVITLIWQFYCCGLGHCCGKGFILGPGTSSCCGCGQKKNKLKWSFWNMHKKHLTNFNTLLW